MKLAKIKFLFLHEIKFDSSNQVSVNLETNQHVNQYVSQYVNVNAYSEFIIFYICSLNKHTIKKPTNYRFIEIIS